VSESGDGGTSLGSGVLAKAAQIPVSLSRLKEASSHLRGFGRLYNTPPRHPYIGDVCLVDKIGLGAQCILRGPEFIDWESKIDAGNSPRSKSWHQNVRKMPHTAHKGGSREVSHVQKFNKQAGWLRKNDAAASLGGSGLKLHLGERKGKGRAKRGDRR
jgi:hypothetical protein